MAKMQKFLGLYRCLCCDSSDLDLVLDLANQPLANYYSKTPDHDFYTYPLQLNLCKSCFHAQLSVSVDRKQIFDDYAYVSGTSQTLNRYFEWFADALTQIKPVSSSILELAANDGSLLNCLMQKGFACTGVDPARNIVEKAQEKNLPIHLGYWPQFAEDLVDKYDVIIAMNVLAHVPDPFSFLLACGKKLNSEGVVIIQPSQARMFQNAEFDTIYHEHISFFNSNSISKLAQRCGLYLAGTAIVKVHGDSPIYFLKRLEDQSSISDYSAFQKGEFGISENLIDYEHEIDLYSLITYEKFSASVKATLQNLTDVINEYKNNGYCICFVGAAAKAMTVLNASGAKPDYLLDESPLKIGYYAPGCNLRVSPLTLAKDFNRPVLFIISAWNFRFELTKKLQSLGVPVRSKFFSYFPVPNWIE